MGTRTPTYYASSDASAPVLTGQNGSLVALLLAVLVNGYGAKSGAGWTQQFSGTNKAVFKMGAGGTNCVLRVLDDGSVATAAAREAICRAAESASTVDALTDPFPLTANVADGSNIWRKSTTADATARAWKALADSRLLLLWVEHSSTQAELHVFGDLEPVYPGDAYCCFMMTRGVSNNTGTVLLFNSNPNAVGSTVTSLRSAMMRSANGSIKGETAAPLNLGSSAFGNTAGTSSVADYPHPYTSKFHMTDAIVVAQGNNTVATASDGAMLRAWIPWLFEPLHGNDLTSMSHGDTFGDTAYNAAADFVYLSANLGAPSGTSAKLVLQTAAAWTPPV